MLALQLHIRENELKFDNAVGLLPRYLLADAKEGTGSNLMHSVLH